MSEGEEVYEYTSQLNKDLMQTKEAIEKSLSELGIKEKALCEVENNSVECVLSIPIEKPKKETPKEAGISTFIDSSRVYVSYIFINANYDNVSGRTTLRVYSYDDNEALKKLVEIVEKNTKN